MAGSTTKKPRDRDGSDEQMKTCDSSDLSGRKEADKQTGHANDQTIETNEN